MLTKYNKAAIFQTGSLFCHVYLALLKFHKSLLWKISTIILVVFSPSRSSFFNAGFCGVNKNHVHSIIRSVLIGFSSLFDMAYCQEKV